jgi:hypothetical protein
MDPYLESHVFWGGIHANLNTRIQTALNRSLPEGYYADIDEYVWLQADDPDERRRLGKPDAFISDQNGSEKAPQGRGGTAMLTAPVTVTLPKAKKRSHKYVKIVGPDNTLVLTVIEVLSPTNKDAADGREKYLTKRDEYIASGTNLVEIDLLRGGDRVPMGKPAPPDADYYIFVSRAQAYPHAGVWPFTVREPIPPFPVPLKADHPGVVLELQPCINEIYDAQRYARRIDYSQPPDRPLRKSDAEWAAELLKKHARKAKK